MHLELLPDGLYGQALRAGKNIKARQIMPPEFGSRWAFRTYPIIIDLPNKKHGFSATLRNIIALYPNWHAKQSALLSGGLAYYLDGFLIVLTLAIHKFKFTKPRNLGWDFEKMGYDGLPNVGTYF